MRWLVVLLLVVFIIGCSFERVACTEDARVCSDGSVVVRVGPDCEFAACPEGLPLAPEGMEEPPYEEPVEEPGEESKKPGGPVMNLEDFKIYLPVKKEEVTFEFMGIWPFGVKGGDHPEGHPGIDLEAKDGTPIRAMGDGLVSEPHDSGHYDYETLSIFHENNFETYYTGNMKDFVYLEGGRVSAGDIIAYYDGDNSIHYGLQQKIPYVSVCPVDYLDEGAVRDLEELFERAIYPEQDEFPLLCNPCPETGCK